MNYSDSIHYLDYVATFGGELGLANINRLLRELGNPHNSLKVIHVGGSNGKGSVSNLMANILTASSYRVGLFTSPYIMSYNEAIAINQQLISNDDLTNVTGLIKQACETIVTKGYSQPTEFECLTAMALMYFKLQEVDFAIIEVGLGGRLDATNVFDTPLLTIITSISLDHTDFLGDTLEKIAFEKAGIIKKDCPVVLGPSQKDVFTVINQWANENNAPFHYLSDEETSIRVNRKSDYSRTFSINTPIFCYKDLSTVLLGNHQLTNICITLQGINVLINYHHINISVDNIREGIKKTSIKCRCEYLQDTENILIDGAHNTDSMQAFTSVLADYFNNKEMVILFGALGDKDIDGMLDQLAKYSQKIVLTLPLSSRATPLDTLEKTARKHFSDVTIIDDYQKAYEYLQQYSDNQLICCVGSFYLVYPLREFILS